MTELPERTAETLKAFRRIFLPNAEAVDERIDRAVADTGTAKAAIRALIGAPAFRLRHAHVFQGIGHAYEAAQIETSASEEELAVLFGQMEAAWRRLGEESPYHSVLASQATGPRGSDVEAFRASGRAEVEALMRTLERSGPLPAHATLLEVGCGMGRMTIPLATRFERVVAMDISASHLAAARAYAEEAGVRNAEFRLLQSVDALAAGAFDIVLCFQVLQHNPPPVIARMLDRIFAALRPGGRALVHLVHHRVGYAFDTASYLAAGGVREEIEMHAFPQREAFRIAREAGCHPVDAVDVALHRRDSIHAQFCTFRKDA